MNAEIKNYFQEIRRHLHLDPKIEKRVLVEFYSHITEKTKEFQKKGIPKDSSVSMALSSFGGAQAVARLMYEAHSRGSWQDAFITAVPHLLVSALFFGHFWRNPVLAPFAFGCIVAITLLGWWHGKPNWLFSWVAYSVFPLLVGAFSLERVVTRSVVSIITGEGNLWSWLLLLPVAAFYSLSLCIILYAIFKIGHRDWVLASVMIVPQPILGFWLFKIEKLGSFFMANGSNMHQWDYAMATVFLLLGITLAIFIRLRQRLLKAGALLTIGTLAGVFVIFTIWGEVRFFTLLIVTGLMFLLFISPSLLRGRAAKEDDKNEVRYLPV